MTELQRDLRRARREKELSQEDVAARAGMTQQGLYVIEKRARPSLEAICRVAAVLGYRVALVPLDAEEEA